MKLFFDTEFTGLHQATTLVSIGIIAENGHTFYAEITDYDKSQLDDWLRENVIANLFLTDIAGSLQDVCIDPHIAVKGTGEEISRVLKFWLARFVTIEFWSDCLAYDWVLLNALLADYSNGYPQLPANVYYIPFDLCTLFKIKGIDPDINRESYAGIIEGEVINSKHNSLWDAKVIKACYDKCI